jgi:hypothetical protein
MSGQHAHDSPDPSSRVVSLGSQSTADDTPGTRWEKWRPCTILVRREPFNRIVSLICCCYIMNSFVFFSRKVYSVANIFFLLFFYANMACVPHG